MLDTACPNGQLSNWLSLLPESLYKLVATLIIQRWIKSPIKKLCRVIVSHPLVLNLIQGWLYTARLTFWKAKMCEKDLTYHNVRMYNVGFSQWAATYMYNTKSFNINARANNFFFLWSEFSLQLLNLVCFSSWEILFASLISGFFLELQKTQLAKSKISEI